MTSTSTTVTTATRRRDLEPDDLNLHSVLEPDDLGLNLDLDNLHNVKVRRWQPDARAGGDGNPTHRWVVTQHAGRQ
jgi:hypothetical protein